MRQTLPVLIVFVLSLVPGFARADDAGGAAANTEIRGVVQDFVTAWNAHDTATLLRYFTRDGTLTSPSGASAAGRAAIRKLLTKEHRDIYQGTTLAVTTNQITLADQGKATVTGRYTLQGVDIIFGITVAPQGAFTFRLSRQNGRWLIASARILRS